ncbi:MAG TPA: type II secretion system protein [Candidatus Nanoarchaeia archaeon]|nr:type II secretion system protein [Candidatus Nanoarchaeia archaeon]
MKKTLGFTLIEILVVVSIIGLIASIALASLGQTREKAKIARARAEMRQIAEAIIHAQGESGKNLDQIIDPNNTNLTDYCTDCPCRTNYGGPSDIRGNVGVCYTQWLEALTRLEAAGNGTFGLVNFKRDPWGSPYLIDQNEDEPNPFQPGVDPCRHDTLRSAGPNGIASTYFVSDQDNSDASGGNDDFGFQLPFSRNHPTCSN